MNLAHKLTTSLIAALVCASCAAQYYRIKENAPPSIPLPEWPGPVGDFNGNGLPELVAYQTLLLDPGINGITSPVTVPLPGLGSAFYVAGHLDNDSNLDLFGHSGWTVSTEALLGQGGGTFTSLPVSLGLSTQGSIFQSALLVDLNQDSLDDLILVVYDATTVRLQVVLNSFPQWTPGWSLVLPHLIFAQSGDFDGDGNADLCWLPHPLLYPSGLNTPPPLLNQLSVVFGDGIGGFGPMVVHPFGAGPPLPLNLRPLTGDLDADGLTDVIMPGDGPPEFRIWYGHASLGLEPPTLLAWPTNFGPAGSQNLAVWQYLAYDVDADGDVDFVRNAAPLALVPFPYTVHPMVIDVLSGTGYRTWAASVRRDLVFPPPAGTLFTAADFDADGDVDLIGTGTQGIAPNAIRLENVARFGPGCSGTGGSVPGTDQGDLTLGNQGYFVAVHGAAPNALAAFGVSLGLAPSAGCGVYLDLSPGQLVLPTASFGFTTTDQAGAAILGVPLPATSLLAGGAVISQWFVVDPAGTLGAGGTTFSASQGRTLVLW